ncbi:kinase-like domain-containing protein [Truncatella angustata]|uniref:non-specific serine/threonine protein kinase n=1 Tax=Truncatella angustata TaxID=152316 RepID=A0A9P8RMW8_9PEZI|nr:kinase-like domain-containing protein [Truncatella angustata]KAH6646076.1 kinase-like domain-containing protein [Truncatella angustata]
MPRFILKVRAPFLTVLGSVLAKTRHRAVSHMAHSRYVCNADAEPLHRYRAGGYHPVKLGDLLNKERYKILHKLGWGGYSTTWAAYDRRQNRYVAIQILQRMSALADDHLGRAHLVQMLDHFTLAGPNGVHGCLVLELLGVSVVNFIDSFCRHERLPAVLAKSITYQVLLGIDLLAQHRIGHGDIHTGNLAIAIPDLHTLSEKQFFDKFGGPDTAPMRRTDGASLEDHRPDYLVRNASLKMSLRESLHSSPVVKIIDFGESYIDDHAPKTLHTPLAMRAPETVFGDQIDHRVDMWSMGCLIYFELMTGQPPFDVIMLTPATLVSQMIDFSTDELPARWQEKWQAIRNGISKVYFDENKCPEFTKSDIDIISNLIGQMLKFDPTSRALANDILDNPWFTRSI